MNPETRLRKAQTGDAALLMELSQATFRETYGGMMQAPDIEAYVMSEFSLPASEQLLADPRSYVYFAVKDETVVGYSVLRESKTLVELPEKRVSEITRLYVLRRYHGYQLGKSLLQKQIAVSETLQLNGVWLSVWEKNHLAKKFYEKHGFLHIGDQSFTVGTDVQNDFIYFLKTRV